MLFVHLIVTLARLMGTGGAKAIVAENLLMKQQLLVACRSRQRAVMRKNIISHSIVDIFFGLQSRAYIAAVCANE